MVKIIRNFFLTQILKQIIVTFRQSMSYAVRGQVSKALYWFMVRNYVSIFGNRVRASDQSSSDLTFKLRKDGFMELEKLSDETTASLIEYFLASQKEEYADLKSFFNRKRAENFVRSEEVDICLNRDLCLSVLTDLKLMPIVEEFLRLDKRDISISAKVDALFKLDGERKLRNNYDDALEFHRDIDSLRFVKAFSYLVDIEKGCGEHEVCIRSHKFLPLSLRPIQRQKYANLKNTLPYFELKSVTGKAGFSWIEDTTTYHRGTVPTYGDRLILSLSFNDTKSTQHIYDKGYYHLNKVEFCAL